MGTIISVPNNHPRVVDMTIKEELKNLNSMTESVGGVAIAELPYFNTKKLGVTSIETEVMDETIVVSIELHKPELLIGRKGRNIQMLTNWLENAVSLQVRIDVQKADLFK